MKKILFILFCIVLVSCSKKIVEPDVKPTYFRFSFISEDSLSSYTTIKYVPLK